MRKGCDGEKKQGKKKEKTDGKSGHYVIASSRPLERRTLVPILVIIPWDNHETPFYDPFNTLETSHIKNFGVFPKEVQGYLLLICNLENNCTD